MSLSSEGAIRSFPSAHRGIRHNGASNSVKLVGVTDPGELGYRTAGVVELVYTAHSECVAERHGGSSPLTGTNAPVVELVYTAFSKSVVERHEGSSPSRGTR